MFSWTTSFLWSRHRNQTESGTCTSGPISSLVGVEAVHVRLTWLEAEVHVQAVGVCTRRSRGQVDGTSAHGRGAIDSRSNKHSAYSSSAHLSVDDDVLYP